MAVIQKKVERTKRLISILQEHNGGSIKDLATKLNVSEMTVRRDLHDLNQKRVVSLVHGAAIFNSDADLSTLQSDYHVHTEKTMNFAKKERIGLAAAKLVQPGDTVIVDIGTTAERLAHHLPSRSRISVICFTMNTLLEVYEKEIERLVFGGGYYHPGTQLFEGRETVELVSRLRATKLFLSAAGISEEFGLTCANQYEVSIKQACIASSMQKILIADSTKFGLLRPAFFTAMEQMDVVVTDNELSDEWRQILRKIGIEVVIA